VEVLFEELRVDRSAQRDRRSDRGRSWPRSTTTNSGAPPAHARFRRWWPWKTGVSPRNAETIAAIAHRIEEFPRCAKGLRKGGLVGSSRVIAEHAADGSDQHYAEMAAYSTVNQLRTASNWNRDPKPEAEPRSEPPRSISKTADEAVRYLADHPAARRGRHVRRRLASHRDALISQWKRDHPDGSSEHTPPLPNTVDAFMSLVETGWDADVARRPHAQRTTVVVHVDLQTRVAALHLGPLYPMTTAAT